MSDARMTERTSAGRGSRRIAHLAVFLLFLVLAGLTAPSVLMSPADRVIGNIDYAGLRGEMFHQSDLLEHARLGTLPRYYHSERIAHPDGQDLREYIGFSLHLFLYLPDQLNHLHHNLLSI